MTESGDRDQRNLTRKDLIEQVRREVGSYTAAKAVVTSYFNEIEQALVAGDVVKLCNFGRFETGHKAQRIGRNPRNNEEKVITARTVVKFRPCRKLRSAVRSYTNDGNGKQG